LKGTTIDYSKPLFKLDKQAMHYSIRTAAEDIFPESTLCTACHSSFSLLAIGKIDGAVKLFVPFFSGAGER
jgi:hypothetical protein